MRRDQVIDSAVEAFYRVYNSMGYGFGRDIYLKAMIMELRRQGLQVRTDCPIAIYYRGMEVGEIRADILLEDSLMMTLTAAPLIKDHHELRFENLVSSTWCDAGLFCNFGTAPELVRKINTDVRSINNTALAGARCA